MTKPPVIGILETGRPPEDLAPEHGNYPMMVQDWLDLPEAKFISFAALDGELPKDPRMADLWVITGSRFGVYEGHPWIAPLEGFVRACRDAGVPMVGICFGHQVIAQALGGDVGVDRQTLAEVHGRDLALVQRTQHIRRDVLRAAGSLAARVDLLRHGPSVRPTPGATACPTSASRTLNAPTRTACKTSRGT